MLEVLYDTHIWQVGDRKNWHGLIKAKAKMVADERNRDAIDHPHPDN